MRVATAETGAAWNELFGGSTSLSAHRPYARTPVRHRPKVLTTHYADVVGVTRGEAGPAV